MLRKAATTATRCTPQIFTERFPGGALYRGSHTHVKQQLLTEALDWAVQHPAGLCQMHKCCNLATVMSKPCGLSSAVELGIA